MATSYPKGWFPSARRLCLFIDSALRRRIKIWDTALIVHTTDELLAELAPRDCRTRPEQAIPISVSAWDMNRPQHIPRKLDAAEVAQPIRDLKQRIADAHQRGAHSQPIRRAMFEACTRGKEHRAH